MNPLDTELHDARLTALTVDYIARSATIDVEYYPTEDAPQRTLGQIQFVGVAKFNEVSDLAELQSHQSAGNITQWVPASGAGTTFIYLTGGLIAITADSLRFSVEA